MQNVSREVVSYECDTNCRLTEMQSAHKMQKKPLRWLRLKFNKRLKENEEETKIVYQ